MREQFNICVDDSNVEILDWINTHFDNGNWHKNFEATVTLREFDYTEDGEQFFVDSKDTVNEIAWIDINYKEYRMSDIPDDYLINIVRFIMNGGGFTEFRTEEKMANLVNELSKRGLVL